MRSIYVASMFGLFVCVVALVCALPVGVYYTWMVAIHPSVDEHRDMIKAACITCAFSFGISILLLIASAMSYDALRDRR